MLPAPLAGEHSGFGPVLVLGYTDLGDFLVVIDSGEFKLVEMANVRAEWRYNWRTHRWMDVADPLDDPEDTDDGGEEVPGRLPDADGEDEGDPGEGGDGGAGDVDPGEADVSVWGPPGT